MASHSRLTDMQLVLLNTASQRANGNFFPAAESLRSGQSRIPKAVQSLIKRGFAAEIEVGVQVPSWRKDGDRRLGVAITSQGRVAIGEAEEREGETEAPGHPPADSPPSERTSGIIRAGTKQAMLVGMLESEEGASIQQIVDATGWLPHTTRAALTGLKKRGFSVTSEKVAGIGRYHAKRPA